MRKQQQFWYNEHDNFESLPYLSDPTPHNGVVYFLSELQNYGVELEDCTGIDLGCGGGRNAVYAAQQGVQMVAVDYVETALQHTGRLAAERGVALTLYHAALDEPWAFTDDAQFDLAIDSFASIDIETPEGRALYRDELWRVLRPGGYAFVAVVAAHDEIEQELARLSPGPEPNSTIWHNGKYQKNYTAEELQEFYSSFRILMLEEVNVPNAFKLGKAFTATDFWVMLQKPV